MFRYPPKTILASLRACKTVTLFGSLTDIYKVTFWNSRKQPYLIELKTEFDGTTNFGYPDPQGFKEMANWSLTQTLDKATALKKLNACDYSTAGNVPDVDSLLFVKDLLKR